MPDKAALYIHIPFCIAKCDYCDFSSSCASSVPDDYVDSVLKEIAFLKDFYNVQDFSSVYIGGGTPSLLSLQQIERLFDFFMLNREFSHCTEITFETNPESICREKILLLKDCGVTRLSVGIQSVNAGSLKSAGRHCTPEKIYEALELIGAFWDKGVNLDLIAGLPGENKDSFTKSLKTVTDFNPEHVSLYTLTVEEDTPLYKNIQAKKVHFSEDEADSLWLYGRDFLEKHGYEQYEVSNFCKKGNESIHNMAYWMQKDYLGAGAAACGTVYIYAENGRLSFAERTVNTLDFNEYIKFWSSFNFKNSKEISVHTEFSNLPRNLEHLDPDTLEFEFLMMGLRTLKGVSENEYRKRFGKNLFERLQGSDCKKIWTSYEKQGRALHYAEGDDTRYALTKEGILFLNSLLLNY